MNGPHDVIGRTDRRRFLAGAGVLGIGSMAGCFGWISDDGNDDEESADLAQLGYGRDDADLEGTPIGEMDDLSGELTLYSGRHEFLVGALISALEDYYDDFSVDVRYGGSTDLVNQIDNEGSGSPADVFYSVNAGALGALANTGYTAELPEEVTSMVRSEFRTSDWIGTSGRARSIPYNTNEYSESDVPSDILAFPEDFDGDLGWAPSYGSCQAFVTAMRVLHGEDTARQWLTDVVDSGISSYPDEYRVAEAVADGEIDAGFTNHYYIQRVIDSQNDPPIATAFTEGDAGVVFNVAGAAVLDQASDADLAANFVRHLLSAEAQDYFAVRTFEYPLVDGVPPVGELPSIGELDVPDLDLTQLSDLSATVDMMRDAGITI